MGRPSQVHDPVQQQKSDPLLVLSGSENHVSAVGAVAKGDVDRRAAVEGSEGQGLAGDAAGGSGAARGEVGAGSGVAGEAERRERIAGADDRQIVVGAGRDLQRALELIEDLVCPLAGTNVAPAALSVAV